MSETRTVSRLLTARNAQRPETIPNPMQVSIRIENSGKIHLYDLATETKQEIEGEVRKDSPDKKNPFLDIVPPNQLSFVVIDDATRFLSGLLPVDANGNKEWFDSTMYRLRKDTVSIYLRKKNENGGFDLTKVETDTVENLKPYNDKEDKEAEATTEAKPKSVYKYPFDKMTSCQYVWAYCVQLGQLCRVQLSATGRNAYRLFLRKVKKDELPCFTITGFFPSFGKDSTTKRQADAPVFEKYVPSNIDLEKAETYLEAVAVFTKMDISVLDEPKTGTQPGQIETAVGDFDTADIMAGIGGDIPDDLPM